MKTLLHNRIELLKYNLYTSNNRRLCVNPNPRNGECLCKPITFSNDAPASRLRSVYARAQSECNAVRSRRNIIPVSLSAVSQLSTRRCPTIA